MKYDCPHRNCLQVFPLPPFLLILCGSDVIFFTSSSLDLIQCFINKWTFTAPQAFDWPRSPFYPRFGVAYVDFYKFHV